MSEEQRVELNEDTIIHVVRELNQRGISAVENTEGDGTVRGLTVTRGERVDKVPFGDIVVFHEGRDVRFITAERQKQEEQLGTGAEDAA